MIAVGGNVQVECTSHTVTVPKAPTAQLMFYLNHVSNLLNGVNFPSKLLDYSRYYNLTSDDKAELVAYCYLFSIDELVEHNVMILSPELCGNSLNKFYKITDTRIGVLATNSFTIGDYNVRVAEVMAFCEEYLYQCYINPMKYLLEELQRPKQQITYQTQPSYKKKRRESSSSSSSYEYKKSKCCNMI